MKRIVLTLLLFAVIHKGYTQHDSLISRIFTVSELRADLDTLYRWVTETHPSLYAGANKEQTDRRWKEVSQSVTRPMNRMEFLRVAAPLLTQYHDGHTGLSPEFDLPEFESYSKGGGKLFPMKVMVRDNRIWCVENYLNNGVVIPGDEILSINNIPAKQVVRALLPLWPADDHTSNEVVISRLFSFSLWLNYGWGDKVMTEVKKSGGKTVVGVEGLPVKEFLDRYYPSMRAWKLDLYPDNSLAVIVSGTYGGSLDKAKKFLDSAFTVIKNNNIKNVALDIRNNGGGNSQLGRAVLGYVSAKPSTATVSKMFRSSPVIESLPERHMLAKAYARARKEWKPVPGGYMIEYGAEQPMYPQNRDLLFNGKFFLLTSPRTFSSAHMTAMEVKCFGIGTIIGEPTGERLNLSGEIIGIELPNTKLPGYIPSALFKTACGDGNQVGVQPDIKVVTKPTDLIAGKDLVLEKLKLKVKS